MYSMQAIEILGAERIGHGYHVIEDQGVYDLARKHKVHFEVYELSLIQIRQCAIMLLILQACPTSSLFTSAQQSLEEHALKQCAFILHISTILSNCIVSI